MRDILNVTRIAKAVRYSTQGLVHLLRNEAAFRQEAVLFAILVVLGWVIGFSLGDQCLQITLMVLVLITEAVNTAIENIVDRISTDRHPLSGVIKDVGSGAVLLSFIPLLLFWVYALASMLRA